MQDNKRSFPGFKYRLLVLIVASLITMQMPGICQSRVTDKSVITINPIADAVINENSTDGDGNHTSRSWKVTVADMVEGK